MYRLSAKTVILVKWGNPGEFQSDLTRMHLLREKEGLELQDTAASPGVNRIEKMFDRCCQEAASALIVYFCAGYPDLDFSERVINAALEGGADLVEIGMPFSDPLADGPDIQKAAQEALAEGVKLHHVVEMGGRIRKGNNAPLLVMTYFNPVLSYGTENFLRDLSEKGIDGLLVPDLPLEESTEVAGLAAKYGLCLVPFVAPTSTPKRLERIGSLANGFIYCVSRTGTTGGRLSSLSNARELSCRMRKVTSKPIALGFGISCPEDAAAVALYFDGVIVGSSLIRLISRNKEDNEVCLEQVREFTFGLKQALRYQKGWGSRLRLSCPGDA